MAETCHGGPMLNETNETNETNEHYADRFALPPAKLVLSGQDEADSTAYMKLL